MVTRNRRRSARFAAAAAALLAACGGSSKKSTPVTLSSVSIVAPSNPQRLVIGRKLRLGAVASYSDGTKRIVTTEATFTSSNTAVVQVVETGPGGAGGRLAAAPLATPAQSANVTARWGGVTSAPVLLSLQREVALGPASGSADPLLPQQWHLENVGSPQTGFAHYATTAGYDIDALRAYAAGYGGAGVNVAVVDSGLELAHEDLADGTAIGGSWNFATGTADPSPLTIDVTEGDHGTSVAGLIGASFGNGVGGMGVAPLVWLQGFNLLAPVADLQGTPNFVAALGAGTGVNGPKADDVWIFNQSFGLGFVLPDIPEPAREAAYWDGVTHLRGGLGAIYVKSAGNGFEGYEGFDVSGLVTAYCGAANAAGLSCESASMDPYNTLPPNIVVGALNASGRRSSYSTAGSAIWVSAPGGEYGADSSCSGCTTDAWAPAMVTVDQSGCGYGFSPWKGLSGFNAGSYFDTYLGNTVNVGCNYTNTFNGTSSAAPVTSGVVALVLEANPSLTWRQVKDVLARSAWLVDPGAAVTVVINGTPYGAEPGWTTNAAGLHFHNWYGFGLIDADVAVSIASEYDPSSMGTLVDTGWLAGAGGGAIPDFSVSGAIGTFSAPRALTIEAVQIRIVTNHGYLGDLAVELRSPSGTRSVLLTPGSGYGPGTGNDVIQLATNAFYGEPATGGQPWRLKVVDAMSGDAGSVMGWSIRIYGY